MALPIAACANQWTVRVPVSGGTVVVPAAELAKLRTAADLLKVRIEPGGAPLLVRRTADGFVAVGGRCTHSGCEVLGDAAGFDCPCHGSRFGVAGERIDGPALADLPRLPVSEREDGLHVEVGR